MRGRGGGTFPTSTDHQTAPGCRFASSLRVVMSVIVCNTTPSLSHRHTTSVSRETPRESPSRESSHSSIGCLVSIQRLACSITKLLRKWRHSRPAATLAPNDHCFDIRARLSLDCQRVLTREDEGMFTVQFRSAWYLESFITLEAAVAHGMSTGRPFDVAEDSGAVAWVWEMRP